MVDQRTSKKPLIHLEIQDKITNRPYQKEAVTVLCESIMNHHRKLLLVQATGSGKTRVSISLVDVLRRHNYVKNILFLADRKALVSQAKKSYSNLLPDLTVCNLLENKEDPESSRMIFSTYPTMLNACLLYTSHLEYLNHMQEYQQPSYCLQRQGQVVPTKFGFTI